MREPMMNETAVPEKVVIDLSGHMKEAFGRSPGAAEDALPGDGGAVRIDNKDLRDRAAAVLRILDTREWLEKEREIRQEDLETVCIAAAGEVQGRCAQFQVTLRAAPDLCTLSMLIPMAEKLPPAVLKRMLLRINNTPCMAKLFCREDIEDLCIISTFPVSGGIREQDFLCALNDMAMVTFRALRLAGEEHRRMKVQRG